MDTVPTEFQAFVPDNYSTLSADMQSKTLRYLQTLDEIERKAFMIAKTHLGTSFNIYRSNGYIAWAKALS